jgi:putative transposase
LRFRTAASSCTDVTCYPLTVMDAASRYLLACIGFHAPTADNVHGVFVELFRRFGLPKAIRSDNGEPFASISKAAGLTTLSAWWARLGIKLERIDPGEPQQNGRHERMHRTLKQATCSPPRSTLGWQQRAFDRFRRGYKRDANVTRDDGANGEVSAGTLRILNARVEQEIQINCPKPDKST